MADIESHARNLEEIAREMEAAGIGGGLVNGHASILRRMAACMRADAAAGRTPYEFTDEAVHHIPSPRLSASAAAALANIDKMNEGMQNSAALPK